MGQRHMTYVITEGSYEATTINTIYNQWNFVKLQAWKLQRVINYFKEFKRGGEALPETFFAVAGLSPESGWVGGYHNEDWYKDGTQPFDEDNNNGWTIIKIIQSGEYGEYKYEIQLCCIWGSEDDKAVKTTYKPVETKRYFSIEKATGRDTPESIEVYNKAVNYIADNTTYNPKLKEEAVKLIKKHLAGKKSIAA